MSTTEDPDIEPTWVSVYDDGSALDGGLARQYLFCMYWALTTLTTVGYGDITPTNDSERAYTLGCLFIGALVFGFLLSTLADLYSKFDANAVRIDEKLHLAVAQCMWVCQRACDHAHSYDMRKYARTRCVPEYL